MQQRHFTQEDIKHRIECVSQRLKVRDNPGRQDHRQLRHRHAGKRHGDTDQHTNHTVSHQRIAGEGVEQQADTLCRHDIKEADKQHIQRVTRHFGAGKRHRAASSTISRAVKTAYTVPVSPEHH